MIDGRESVITNNVAGNLSEYVTGIRCDNGDKQKLVERLMTDHFRLKKEYGLPEQKLKYNDVLGYIVALNRIAKQKGIYIYGSEDYSKKFGGSLEEGFCDDETGDIYINEIVNPLVKASVLEHEIVHGMQVANGDVINGRSIEEMEYEAYVVANCKLSLLKTDPTSVFDHMFAMGMVRSCDSWYKRNGGVPKWR